MKIIKGCLGIPLWVDLFLHMQRRGILLCNILSSSTPAQKILALRRARVWNEKNQRIWWGIHRNASFPLTSPGGYSGVLGRTRQYCYTIITNSPQVILKGEVEGQSFSNYVNMLLGPYLVRRAQTLMYQAKPAQSSGYF